MMEWDNILILFRLENMIYWIVSIVVIVLTTIRQFNKQDKKKDEQGKKILVNLSTIEKQNVLILDKLDTHSSDIKSIKKDLNAIDHRVTRLENSHANLYKKINQEEKK